MKSDKLQTLMDLSKTLLEVEQARLREAQSARTQVANKVSALNDAVSRQHDVIAAELEAPVAGPVLDQWGAWVDRKRMALNAELALKSSVWEEQRQTTLMTFGRLHALQKLHAKAHADTKQKARRHAAKG